jgi:propionate CoA-transferase
MKSKVTAVDEAVEIISPGDTVTISGNGEALLPDRVLQALEKRYLASDQPRDLTLYYPIIPGMQREGTGLDRLAHAGLIKRIITGTYYTLNVRKICKLLQTNEVEAYLIPMGANWQLMRAIAGGMPGAITPVGVGSFIDPRKGRAKLTPRTKEDIVEVIELDGKEYLFYRSFPINVAIIRGTTADEWGNISIEEEPASLGILDMAMAAKNSGGTVIAQVKRITKVGTIHPYRVVVPGIFVDKIVLDPHQQDFFPYNPYYTGDARMPVDQFEGLPLNWQKVIARRAAMQLRPGQVINLGFGLPAGVPAVAQEEGLSDDVVFGVEHGPLGGTPATKESFGAGVNALAIMDSPDIFNMYDGGSLDITFLGLAQLDQAGNVNVSNIGGMQNLGGFMDIIWRTPEIVFCGAFSAGGFRADIRDEKLVILTEGKIRKFVKKPAEKTFDASRANRQGQKVTYVTERAVFELGEEGIILTEIAPGIDLKEDVLDHMEFEPVIRNPVQIMSRRLFRPEIMGLKETFSA